MQMTGTMMLKNEISFITVKHDVWKEFVFERSVTEMELFYLHIDTDLSEWCKKLVLVRYSGSQPF